MEIGIIELEESIKEAYNDGLNEGIRKYRHLCASCTANITECDGTPEFGDGYGLDNVCNCDKHQQKDAQNTNIPK